MWFWFYNIALLVLATSALVIALECVSTLRRQRRQAIMPLVHVLERDATDGTSARTSTLYLANRGSGVAVGVSLAWSAPPRVSRAAVSYLPDVLAAGEEVRLTHPYEPAALREVRASVRYAGIDGELHVCQFDGERHRYDAMYVQPKLQRFGTTTTTAEAQSGDATSVEASKAEGR